MLLPLLLGQGTAGPVTHDTSGALGGQAAQVVGAATNFTPHGTAGVLAGQTATIAGAADRQAAVVPHTTSGALTGQGSTVVGASANFRAFGSSGVLSGQGAIVVGAADRQAAIIPHIASGGLVGPGAAVTGGALRFRAFDSSGALPGQEAIIVGDADVQITIEHDSGGDLIGPGAIIIGDATLIDPPTGGGGPGNTVSIQRRKPRGWANEREAFEQSLREPDEKRQADLDRIAQALTDSGQAQAQRIARKLEDYQGEIGQIESLHRELAKLEAAQRSRELQAQRNQDLQAAAAELSEILRDDEDVANALVAMHEHETRLMLGVLGIAIR